MVIPTLTTEQRQEALMKATEARRRRASIKTALKNRSISLEEVFEQSKTDPAIAQMRAKDLLQSLPRVGSHTAQHLMREIGIAPSRRIRGLGRLQRAQLLEWVE